MNSRIVDRGQQVSQRLNVGVFGASGFVGCSVMEALSQDPRVAARALTAPRLAAHGRTVEELESEVPLGELEDLVEQLRGVDVVVNAAGDPGASSLDVDALVGANALFPLALLKAAERAGVRRLVHVSSAVVQGAKETLDSSRDVRPFSPYSLSKVLGEQVLESAHGVQVVVYRPPSVHAAGRNVTTKISRIAASPLAVVAAPGTALSPQALLPNVAAAIAFLATWEGDLPEVVHHPHEGVTVSTLMQDLGDGREPVKIPRWLALVVVALVVWVGRWHAPTAANARRVELLLLGQSQAWSWFDEQGWTPPVCREGWQALGAASETPGDSSAGETVLLGVTIPESAAQFLTAQVNELVDRGHTVHVVYGPDGQGPVTSFDARATQAVLPVRRNPAPLQDLGGLFALIRHIRRVRPSVVVMGTPKMSLLGLLAAKMCRVPRRLHVVHGLRLEGSSGARRRLLWAMERLSTACATEVIPVSQSLSDELRRLRLARPDKLRGVGPGSIAGVDPARFAPPSPAEKAAAREGFGLPSTGPVLGFVGRITADKGLTHMVDIWKTLSLEQPDAWFLVVGPDEATNQGLGEAIHELAGLPRVVLPGPVKDPRSAFHAMDVLLLQTKREGFVVVVLEAAASGVPAVVSEVTGTVDAVVDGVTGTLVPWGDVQSTLDAVRGYLEDPARRIQHGMDARRRVEADFSSSSVVTAWVDHFVNEQRRGGDDG